MFKNVIPSDDDDDGGEEGDHERGGDPHQVILTLNSYITSYRRAGVK